MEHEWYTPNWFSMGEGTDMSTPETFVLTPGAIKAIRRGIAKARWSGGLSLEMMFELGLGYLVFKQAKHRYYDTDEVIYITPDGSGKRLKHHLRSLSDPTLGKFYWRVEKLEQWLQFEQLEQLLQCLTRYLKPWLYELICYLKLLKLIPEFPWGIRHLCTTMPWTIWPALVVLWGVCWMFYGSPTGNGYEDSLDWAYFFNLPRSGESAHQSNGSTTSALQSSSPFESRVDTQWANSVDTTAFSDTHFAIADNAEHSPSVVLDGGIPISAPQLASGSSEVVPAHTAEHQVFRAPSAPMPYAVALPVHQTAEDFSTAGSSFECKTCQKTFARLFTLQRHQREKHPAPTIKVDAFLCPNSQCKKSKPESAFKRQDHLDRHLKVCRSKEATSSSSMVGPQKRQEPESRAPASLTISSTPTERTSIINDCVQLPGSRKRRAVTPDIKDVEDDLILDGLKKKYKARKLVLEEKERECREERVKLDVLAACIRDWEREAEEAAAQNQTFSV